MIVYILSVGLLQAFLMIFHYKTTDCLESNQKSVSVPDGNKYDIEGLAECTSIVDYEYDTAGRLIHAYGYHERDDNSGTWSSRDKHIYTYDSKGRLLEDKYYLTYISEGKENPVSITTYTYYSDGSYTVTKKYGLSEVKTSYNKDHLITNQADEIFYTYDKNGRFITLRVRENDKIITKATVKWDCEAYQSIEIMKLSGNEYAVWVDQYNQDWQQVFGVFYQGKLNSFNFTYEDIERIGRIYYCADYINGQMAEEMINGRTKEVDGYYASRYEFNDYDEEGKKICCLWTLMSDNRAYATQYLYGGSDKVGREIHYTIRGGFCYHLFDGSNIAFNKNEKNFLTEIIRTDSEGQIMTHYELDSKHKLIYKKQEADIVK